MINLTTVVNATQLESLENYINRYIELEELSGIYRDELLTDLYDLETSCRNLLNSITVIEVEQKHPGDVALEMLYSTEAWNITDAIKKTLDKFVEFFKKIFDYIGKFTVAKLELVIKAVETWAAYIKANPTKIDAIMDNFKEDTHKVCTVEHLINFMKLAQKYYNESGQQVNNVNTLSASNVGNSDNTSIETVFAAVACTEDYKKAWEIVAVNFTKDEATGTDSRELPKAGGWADVSKITNLIKSFQSIFDTMSHVKQLQTYCNKIVTDLKKESSTDDNLAQLNKEKIKFLKNLSKDVLSELMGRVGKSCNLAGSECTQFNRKSESKTT